MAQKTKEFDLKDSESNERKLTVTLFPAGYGLQIQLRVVRLILPVLGSAGTLSSKDSDFNKDGSSILEQLMKNPNILDNITKALMNALHEDKVIKLINDLLKTTRLDGKDLGRQEIFDEVFTGEYKLLFESVKCSLEANFGNFFGENGIGSLLDKYLPMPNLT